MRPLEAGARADSTLPPARRCARVCQPRPRGRALHPVPLLRMRAREPEAALAPVDLLLSRPFSELPPFLPVSLFPGSNSLFFKRRVFYF